MDIFKEGGVQDNIVRLGIKVKLISGNLWNGIVPRHQKLGLFLIDYLLKVWGVALWDWFENIIVVDNYVPQWWIELDDGLSWLFTT